LSSGQRPSVLPLFLPAVPGERFCLLHRPAQGVLVRGGIVYVPPFAEEMHKARRMAAIQARSFAQLGFVVLQPDLFGCGDSSGELREARLHVWMRDVQEAAAWLQGQGIGPIWLWGLRLGALLAAHSAAALQPRPERLILWQPVLSGETHLTQFLRIGVAADMFSTNRGSGGGRALRERLASGEAFEVAGYDVTPELAQAIDTLRLVDARMDGMQVHWFEVATDSSAGLAPASARAVAACRDQGTEVYCHVIAGDPFWATVEITECDGLIQQTTGVADDRCPVATKNRP
jgi:exosortase A-associated hydrolase 2